MKNLAWTVLKPTPSPASWIYSPEKVLSVKAVKDDTMEVKVGCPKTESVRDVAAARRHRLKTLGLIADWERAKLRWERSPGRCGR